MARRAGIAVVKRKRATGNFEANAVARGEIAGSRLQIEFPVVNFAGRVNGIRKKPTRARDAHANKFGRPIRTYAHEFRREIGMR